MGLVIPNLADAAFAEQARPDSTDIDAMQRALAQIGVKTGCAVTAQGSPNMTVAVAAGTIFDAGREQAVAGGNVTITAAHASLGRRDIVVADNATGNLSAVAGTAAATPVKPAIPAGDILLAEVYVPAADTAINTNQITDKRCTLVAPPGVGVPWTEINKSADQDVTNSTVFADDTELQFGVTAGKRYAVDALFWMSTSNISGLGRFQFAVAAGTMKGHGSVLSGGTGITSLLTNVAAVSPTVSVSFGAGDSEFGTLVRVTFAFEATNTTTFKTQFCNNTAGAGFTTRMGKGSLLRWRLLN